MNQSLDTLAKNLEEEDFEPLRKEYGEDLELLTRKQVFPYRFLRNLKCMSHEGLIPKEWFGSRLGRGEVFEKGKEKEVKVCPISDKDYEHYVKVWKTFGFKTFGEYVSFYCALDVELLAIVLKKFVKTCMRDFGLDPTKSYTAPGFFWKAMLKMTGVKLELLTDPTKYAFFEKCIRGGVSVVSNRYAKANNPYMEEGYDPSKKTTYIVEWDANSLYASVMVEELPVGKFYWACEKMLKELEEGLGSGKKLTSGKSAFLCVDLEYPEELHDEHNDYSLAPEKMVINGVEKLAPNLGDKKEYHTTYEALLFYLEKGLVLKKVHKAITCKTEAFLRPYIEFCAEKRREAKRRGDRFGDEFYKLAGNSVYGKTFEGVRDRCNTKFVGGRDRKRLTKYFSQPNFVSSCILPGSNIVMVQMGKVSVTLDKPIYLGATILEKSKRDMFKFHYN